MTNRQAEKAAGELASSRRNPEHRGVRSLAPQKSEELMSHATNKKFTNGRFTKGTSGNPAGRPRGSRNQSTLIMEALLEGEAEQLMRKTIDLGKEGNPIALRLCLDRLLPPRKDRPIQVTLPRLDTTKQLDSAISAILQAVSKGDLTPSGTARTIRAVFSPGLNVVLSDWFSKF